MRNIQARWKDADKFKLGTKMLKHAVIGLLILYGIKYLV